MAGSKMKVGDKFPTFRELEAAVKGYSEEKFVQFYKRDCRTVTAAKTKVKRFLNERLGMYQVVYCCIKGGKSFKSRSKGERDTSTFQAGCPAFVKCRASDDGNFLEVIEMNEDHNHELSKLLYSHLPQTRALREPGAKEEATQLLALHANKKLVKKRIEEKTGKLVLLKDLSNAASSLRPQTRNDLIKTAALLQNEHGTDYHILADGENFQGILLSNESMRSNMDAYPEFLGIDATYKLLEIRTPVYVMHVEDSNGDTETVCVAILVNESAPTIKWMLEKFKELHPSWPKVKCVMADKDLLERDLLKESFPQSKVLICVFHTLKTFRREIACNKMNITAEERDQALALLQKMVLSRSSEKFEELQLEFDNNVCQEIRSYYDKNWRPIKDEWYTGPKFMSENFNNTTNNRIESLNAKLKSVIKKNSSLEEFVCSLFTVLNALSDERDHRALTSISKRPCKAPSSPEEAMYQESLTPYAFKLVREQIYLSAKRVPSDQKADVFTFEASSGNTSTTKTNCNCSFWNAMRLPCRHVFAVRRTLNISLFDDKLFLKRWSKAYYYCHQRAFLSQEKCTTEHSISEQAAKPRRPMSQHEKYREVFPTCKYIAQLAAEETGERYQGRLKVLLALSEAWEQGREIEIVEVLRHEASSPSSPEQVRRQLELTVSVEENAESPKAASGEDWDTSETADQNNSHDQPDLPQAPLSHTGAEPLHTTPEKEQRAHNAGACETPDEVRKAQPRENTLAPASSAGPSDYMRERLGKLKVPAKVKSRGRPKGAEKTVIGLPRRRQGPHKSAATLQPFRDLPPQEKELRILSCLVPQGLLSEVQQGKLLLGEDQVETIPSRIPETILDEEVHLDCVQKYFTEDGWTAVLATVKVKKQTIKWKCNECRDLLEEDPSVICDLCLCWFHQICTSLSSVIKKNSSLEEFVCSLFTVLNALSDERDHRALTSISMSFHGEL
ncbi:zinc finger SWIM domain-containing protein 3-like [Rhipicephalus microplus]|uniref:zinc finger SWIM domain-containing protein 3-like n=1 Tax=Rhipicephalus microplus TaxID=6941 RepID=UPI003F6D0817